MLFAFPEAVNVNKLVLVLESITAISTVSEAPLVSALKLTAYASQASGNGIPILPVAPFPKDHSN